MDPEVDRLERELGTVYGIDYTRILPTRDFRAVTAVSNYDALIADMLANPKKYRNAHFLGGPTRFYSRGEVNEVFYRYGLRRVAKFINAVNFLIAEA